MNLNEKAQIIKQLEETSELFKEFLKKETIRARRYVPGEDTSNITISILDGPLLADGWIAHDILNPEVQWYIHPKHYFHNI